MKIPALNTYSNPYIQDTERAQVNTQSVARARKANAGKDQENLKFDHQAYNELLTGKERDFFIKLFPENSEQIKKHVLFNKNGKIQSGNVNKGMIVDGRV